MERKIRLFCFPNAGGTAQIYRRWFQYVDEAAVELVPVELSGRGRRYAQPLFTSLEDIVEDAFSLIRRDLDLLPYMLFGHSMGSLIVYELTKKIMQGGHRTPSHIFFSGRSAPNQPTKLKRSELPDEELKQEIFGFGGTPREVLEDPGFTEMYLPVIRADLKAVEAYPTGGEMTPLPCSISIFNGKEDELVSQLEEWRKYTTRETEYRFFEGGHFYIHDQAQEVVNAIQLKARGCLENHTGREIC